MFELTPTNQINKKILAPVDPYLVRRCIPFVSSSPPPDYDPDYVEPDYEKPDYVEPAYEEPKYDGAPTYDGPDEYYEPKDYEPDYDSDSKPDY